MSNIAAIVTKIRNLVVYMQGTKKFRASFTSFGKQLIETYIDQFVVMDSPNDWISSYLMLERAFYLRKPIDKFISVYSKKNKPYEYNDRSYNLTPIRTEDWTLIDQILKFLCPFYEANLFYNGGQFPSLGYSVVLYESLRSSVNIYLSNIFGTTPLDLYINTVKDSLQTYFFHDSLFIFACLVLDPRFKLKIFEDKNWNITISVMTEEYVHLYFRLKEYYNNNYSSGYRFEDFDVSRKPCDGLIFGKSQNIDFWELYFSTPPIIATDNFTFLDFWLTNNFGPLNRFALDLASIAGSTSRILPILQVADNLKDKSPFNFGVDTLAQINLIKSWSHFQELDKIE